MVMEASGSGNGKNSNPLITCVDISMFACTLTVTFILFYQLCALHCALNQDLSIKQEDVDKSQLSEPAYTTQGEASPTGERSSRKHCGTGRENPWPALKPLFDNRQSRWLKHQVSESAEQVLCLWERFHYS